MSNTSIFFKHVSRSLPTITYRLLETFSFIATENPEDTSEVVLRAALSLCGYDKKFSMEELVDLVEGMKEAESQAKAADKDGKAQAPAGSNKKSFGQDYLDWVNSLNIEQLLLVISDYDFPTACKYYSEVPIVAISVAAELFFKSDWLKKQASLESAVVGAGGELGAKKSAPGYDLTNDKSAGMAERKLKSIGF